MQSTTNSAMQTVATTSRGSTLGMGGLGAGPSPPTHRSRAPAAVAASDKPSMASAKPKCTAVTPSRSALAIGVILTPGHQEPLE